MKGNREGRRLVAKAVDEGSTDQLEASPAMYSPMYADPCALSPRVEEHAERWSVFNISSGITGAPGARLCGDKTNEGVFVSPCGGETPYLRVHPKNSPEVISV